MNIPFGRQPIDGPLWFVRDLIMCSLISPIFPYIVKKAKALGLIIFSILMIFKIWLPFTFITSVGFFFFLLGAYLQINKKDLFFMNGLSGKIKKYILISFTSLICFVLFLYSMNEDYYFIALRFSTIICPFILLYITNMLLRKQIIRYSKKLSDSSFFIYAAHWTYAIICSLFVSKLLSNFLFPTSILYQQFSQWFIGSIIAIIILTILHILLKKYLPTLTSYLDGGRG